jgi:hypothetical protein
MFTGLDQLLPFQVRALPELTTATQKLADAQETEWRPNPLASMVVGLDQVVPVQIAASPAEPTAMQKLEAVQDRACKS